MAEQVVLDPIEIAENRLALDITPFIGSAGPDWGDAQIEQFLADAGVYGQVSLDFNVPNRQVTIPLVLQDRADVPFEQIRAALQSKVARFQTEGGWLKRVTGVGNVYGEVVNAQLKFGGSSAQAAGLVDADASLTLTTIPDWFGDELSTTAVVGAGHAVWELADVVRGNYPARVRIIVTDTEGKTQRGLIWAFRSRHYTADPQAALVLEAESLSPVSPAAAGALSGASGGNAVSLATIPLSTDPYNPVWVPVLRTTIAGVGDLKHEGLHRAWARVRAPKSGTNVTPGLRARLAWSIGDLATTVPSPPVSVVGTAVAPTGSVSFARPTFDGGSTIDSYRVTLSPGGATFLGSGSPIPLTGLDAATTYTATVAAHNTQGWSAESAASAAFGTPLPENLLATDLEATSPSPNTIVLTWTRAPDAESETVAYIPTVGGVATLYAGVTPVGANSYTWNGVPAGTHEVDVSSNSNADYTGTNLWAGRVSVVVADPEVSTHIAFGFNAIASHDWYKPPSFNNPYATSYDDALNWLAARADRLSDESGLGGSQTLDRMTQLASRGMRLTFLCNQIPRAWASANAATFASQALAAADLLGPGGTWPTANPGLASWADKVIFELGNEVDIPFNHDTVDPVKYAQLARAAIVAVKAAHPTALCYVFVGSGNWAWQAYTPRPFHRMLLETHADLYSLADGYAIHTYSANAAADAAYVARIRDDIYTLTGAAGKPFAITEINGGTQESERLTYAGALVDALAPMSSNIVVVNYHTYMGYADGTTANSSGYGRANSEGMITSTYVRKNDRAAVWKADVLAYEGGTPPAPPPAADTSNFTAADNTSPPSGNWTNKVYSTDGDMKVWTNQCTPSSGGPCSIWRNAKTYTAPRTGATVVTPAQAGAWSYDCIFLGLANEGGGSLTGYELRVHSNGDWDIWKITAATPTKISTTIANSLVAGDVVTFERSGSNLIGRRNGATVVSVTDTTYTGALHVGIGAYGDATMFDDWTAVEL